MASLALSSLRLHAFSPVQSPFCSVLKTGLRSLGSTSSPSRSLATFRVPTFGYTAEGRDQKFAEGTQGLQEAIVDYEASQMSPVPRNIANTKENNAKIEEEWAKKSQRAIADLSSLPKVHPYSGRSIPVYGDLGDSLRHLDNILSRNKVKLTLRMTERHEKKGYKRRRLESECWRKQFANEVRKKVQLVMKMRDRGA